MSFKTFFKESPMSSYFPFGKKKYSRETNYYCAMVVHQNLQLLYIKLTNFTKDEKKIMEETFCLMIRL